jgi:hypothetical protein
MANSDNLYKQSIDKISVETEAMGGMPMMAPQPQMMMAPQPQMMMAPPPMMIYG